MLNRIGARVEKIGLFPLSIVVFPESSLPLHIFEPRYKQLVARSLEDGVVFGINLVDSSKLYPSGCTAEITEIFRRYPDGRMDVAVTGRKRYELRALYEGDEPYYTGMVEYFDDRPEELDTALRTTTIDMYNELIRIVYPHSHSELLIEDDVYGNVSFFMAQKSGLDINNKQQMLEMRSENDRLRMLHTILEATLPELRRKEKIQQIIMNDGYLPPSQLG